MRQVSGDINIALAASSGMDANFSGQMVLGFCDKSFFKESKDSHNITKRWKIRMQKITANSTKLVSGLWRIGRKQVCSDFLYREIRRFSDALCVTKIEEFGAIVHLQLE